MELGFTRLQQQMASTAASSAGFPQAPFGGLPPFMHPPPPGLGSLQQPLLPGQFGLLQPQGLHPSQVPLQPPDSRALAGGSLPILPGLSPNDQSFILQPPVVPQQAQQGEGQDRVCLTGQGPTPKTGSDPQDRDHPPEASKGVSVQGQNDAAGPDRSSSQPSGEWFLALIRFQSEEIQYKLTEAGSSYSRSCESRLQRLKLHGSGDICWL